MTEDYTKKERYNTLKTIERDDDEMHIPKYHGYVK